jgi:hypothetical protein
MCTNLAVIAVSFSQNDSVNLARQDSGIGAGDCTKRLMLSRLYGGFMVILKTSSWANGRTLCVRLYEPSSCA